MKVRAICCAVAELSFFASEKQETMTLQRFLKTQVGQQDAVILQQMSSSSPPFDYPRPACLFVRSISDRLLQQHSEDAL